MGLAGVLQGQAFPIAAGLMLGSAGSVVVNGPIIAPQHAWVGVGPTGRFVVRDGGSAAGTYVNNQRLSPSDMRELNEGDVITLGDASCQLRFHAA